MHQVFATLMISVLLVQNPSLESSSPKEREAAIERLAVLGNVSAIPVLAEAYKKEPKSDLRAEIIAGFARIRDKAVLPPLAEALRTDIDKDVRLQAIDSILRLYIPIEGNAGPIRTIFNRVQSVFFVADRPMVGPEVSVDGAATTVLAEAMQKDFTDEVRIESARALGSLKATDQVPSLIATLDDPKNREHSEVRLEVIRTLGILRDVSAGPVLEKTLRDDDRTIVAEAAMALGLVGYKEARPAVEDLFRTSSDRTIKRRSIEGIALMRDPGAAALFESLLGNSDDYYRELAAEGLARLHHDPKVIQDRWGQEKKANVRNALAFALVTAGQNDYLNELANALDTRQDYQVHVYLVELGKFEGKLPELYRYLKSPNPKVRAKILRVLGDVGDPSAREQIQAMTEDRDVGVVREAVAALRKITK
jgi:HEAT repeat protein